MQWQKAECIMHAERCRDEMMMMLWAQRSGMTHDRCHRFRQFREPNLLLSFSVFETLTTSLEVVSSWIIPRIIPRIIK